MIQLQNLFDYLLVNYDMRLAIDDSYRIKMAYIREKSGMPYQHLDKFDNKPLSECFPGDFFELFKNEMKQVFSDSQSNAGILNYNYQDDLFFVEFDFIKFPENVASCRLFVTAKGDRTDWLVLQRNLAWRISEASDLDSIFSYVLRLATMSGYMDSGGVYLFNEEFTQLNLYYHLGLSEAFINQVSLILPDSPEWQTVMAGNPVYIDGSFETNVINNKLASEGITTFASIPLRNEGKIIGALNLASHESQFISAIHKTYMEDLASLLSDSIVRMQKQQKAGEGSANYHQLLEAFPDLVVAINFDGTIRYANRRLSQSLGYEPDEIMGENISRLFYLDRQVPIINIINDLTKVENSKLDIPMRSKSGEVLEMQIFSSHSSWDMQTVIILSCRQKKKKENLGNFNMADHINEVLELIPLPSFVVDASTLEIQYTNLLYQKKYGQPERSYRTESFLNLVDQNEQDRLMMIIHQQGISGLSTSPNWTLIQNDGNLTDVLLEVFRIPWSEKETFLVYIFPQSRIGFSNNLINEDRYRDVVDEQLDIICRFTPGGILTFVNNAYCKFFNRESAEFLGLPFSINILREDIDTVSAHLSKISEEHPVRYSQNRMIDGNGKIRWVNWVDRGIYKDGNLIEIQGVGRDITDDMNAKLNSDSLEKRYQSLISEMPVVVYISHANSMHTLYISPQVVQLSGYTPEEILQSKQFLFKILHPDDIEYVEDGYKQRIDGLKNLVLQYRIFHKDGHIVHIQDMGSLFIANDGTALLQGMFMEVGTWHLTENKMANIQKFEQLVKEVSHQLVVASRSEWPQIVNDVLESIGNLIHADRSYIFEIDTSKSTMSNTFEWCADNIDPQIDNLKNLPLEDFEFFIRTLTDEEIVSYSNLNQIPESEQYFRQTLEVQSIKSILVVPMKKEGQLCGYLGFDSVMDYVEWDDQAVFLLRMVGDMLVKSKERVAALP